MRVRSVIDEELRTISVAFEMMGNVPKSLERFLSAAVELHECEPLTISNVLIRLTDGVAEDDLRLALRSRLIHWDYDATPPWAESSARNTRSRRDRIYELLELEPIARATLDDSLPFAPLEEPLVVAEKFKPWYDLESQTAHKFYWSSYKRYLREVRKFKPESIEILDDATTEVIERLACPENPHAYQSKGIVVGYVQSGKTANFTGVIAKAIDVGYRLIIILSGTTDLLRNQTQRRIDMELVGKENLTRFAGNQHDYFDDPDWNTRFVSHGGLPSELGFFDIVRLTTSKSGKKKGDFVPLGQGIQTLEIEKRDKTKPLIDPTNLHYAAARMVVIKKESQRLKYLVEDLAKLGTSNLNDVPTLIIDDESDQASLDTINPNKKYLLSEKKRRSTINGRIVNLLEMLPRAQYVGYTATPTANVFVDPDDEEGIFPKDFLISLPRPVGYMGVREFHDLDENMDELQVEGFAASNRAAFVREVEDPHDVSTDQLSAALDTFVLTGAIKLFRESRKISIDARHHTMLAHESQLQKDHAELAELIRQLWDNAGYHAGGGIERLRTIFENDVLPVSVARAPKLSPLPKFKDLLPHIGESIQRISDGDSPVLVVNGTDEATTPDFDKVPVWKVIVGGAKLSRGYTIEGLTVSYFRRRATYQDTLMQMGRWFGFRPGYSDLVRLYIGVHEPLTAARKRFINLYDAFETICIDEEFFRSQLNRYALPEDGSDPITPRQVPPLVANSNPQLQPTAPYKRFNAYIKSENFGGRWIQRTLCPDIDKDMKSNLDLFESVIAGHPLSHGALGIEGKASFDALHTVIEPDAVRSIMKSYRWSPPNVTSLLTQQLEFLTGEYGDPEVDDCLLMLPLLQKSQRDPWIVSSHSVTTIERSRVGEAGRFKVFGEPRHREVAEAIARRTGHLKLSASCRALSKARRAVMLLYAVYQQVKDYPEEDKYPTMGFELFFPENGLPKRAHFARREPSDAITVSA